MQWLFEREIRPLVFAWRRSILSRDVDAAAALRAAEYTAHLPDGAVLSRDAELALMRSPAYEVRAMSIGNLRIVRDGDGAQASFDMVIASIADGSQSTRYFHSALHFRKRDGRWRAIESHLVAAKRPRPWWKSVVHRVRAIQSSRPGSKHAGIHLSYKGSADFAIERAGRRREGAELPVPPQNLWLGYDYLEQGKLHVDEMLRVAESAGLSFRPGDRILDFGCGAGRMIRHLEHLAATCEIWGMDISAEHIIWCKQNLTPPFHFATTTKVPHLPFEDRSFRLIYCGSVFTHIDDLADAWLLELHRILEPGGMLYVTIHDERTVELLENSSADWLEWLRARPVYRKAKKSFDMMSFNRDHDPQVFYSRDYFLRMLGNAFDVLTVNPEGYFYQTAILARRRVRDSAPPPAQ